MMIGGISIFLNSNEINRGSLFQGDIISQIHLLGAINLNGILYSSRALRPQEYSGWSLTSAPQFGDVMIVSHSCEIALENKVKITSIILAPLRDIHKATAKEKIQEVIDSNLIDKSNLKASYLKYFYLPPNPRLKYSGGAVADFSKLFSVKKDSYHTLLENKIAQLSDDTIASMALKLALYFHRIGVSGVG